jgi:hypothetical protein
MADEGWFSGGLLVDEALKASKTVWRTLKGPGIAVLVFATSLVSASIFGAYHSFGFLTGNPTSEWRATLAIAGPTTAFVLGSLLQVGLWGSVCDRVVEDRAADGFVATIGDAGARLPRIAVVCLPVALAQTLLCCIPWLVAVACSPVIYLVATRPNMAWRERWSAGWDWLRSYAPTFGVLFAIFCAGYGLTQLAILIFWLMSVNVAPYLFDSIVGEGFMVTVVLGGLMVVQALYFLGFSSVFVAVERAERGVADV